MHTYRLLLFAHSHSCGNFLIALGDPFVKSCGLYILVDENDNLRVELSTLLTDLFVISWGVSGGAAAPLPNILGFSVIKCPLAIRGGGQRIFSTCPPNIFLPVNPLVSSPFWILQALFLTPAAEKTKTQAESSSQKLKEKTQPQGGTFLLFSKTQEK